jgi:hypothetical protein
LNDDTNSLTGIDMASDSPRGRLLLLLVGVVLAAFAQPFVQKLTPAKSNDIGTAPYWIFMGIYRGAVILVVLWLSARRKRSLSRRNR